MFVFGGALAAPNWSPDGQWVAFTGLDAGEAYGCMAADDPDWDTCRYEGTAVKIENIQTGEIKRLSDGIEPVWLRDGSGLVFLSNRTDAEEVWFINSAGADLRQLTADGTSKSQVMILPQ
jgi:Tol biopolymer transport system component